MSARIRWTMICLLAACGWLTGAAYLTAAVIISEIFYNLNGSEGADQEWIEITNTGAAAVDLENWTYGDSQDNTFTNPFPAGTELLAGESAVLVAQSEATFQSIWGPGIKVITVSPGISLANTASPTNETVAIRDATSAIVDEVNYETGTNGWPTNTPQGKSIYLRPTFFTTADNDIGANWADSVAGVNGAYTALINNPDIANATAPDVASPGVAVIVPEPCSLALLAMLTICHAGVCRRRGD